MRECIWQFLPNCVENSDAGFFFHALRKQFLGSGSSFLRRRLVARLACMYRMLSKTIESLKGRLPVMFF